MLTITELAAVLGVPVDAVHEEYMEDVGFPSDGDLVSLPGIVLTPNEAPPGMSYYPNSAGKLAVRWDSDRSFTPWESDGIRWVTQSKTGPWAPWKMTGAATANVLRYDVAAATAGASVQVVVTGFGMLDMTPPATGVTGSITCLVEDADSTAAAVTQSATSSIEGVVTVEGAINAKCEAYDSGGLVWGTGNDGQGAEVELTSVGFAATDDMWATGFYRVILS